MLAEASVCIKLVVVVDAGLDRISERDELRHHSVAWVLRAIGHGVELFQDIGKPIVDPTDDIWKLVLDVVHQELGDGALNICSAEAR